jgi:glycerol-3-phosphate dehydrogenase (NAD(P)+)
VKELAIVGAGSWGTALAIVLASRFERIRLWVYETDLALRMYQTRENDLYLPGFLIPTNIDITPELSHALNTAEIVLTAVPSQLVGPIYRQIAPLARAQMVFVSATKGLEEKSLLRPSEIVEGMLPGRVAVLSGPTFAREVASLSPTALVIASTDTGLAECVQSAFSGTTFRLYTSTDPIGVEIGGAIKNVVAIGAGLVHALNLGHNAMAALITRGLAEITRLAVALGGKAQTLSGLAGLGDLVLTCTGELSRNRMVGIELAKGRRLEEIVGSMRMVAEGVKTTSAALELARRHSVEMPITEQMYQMLHQGLPPREAIRRLMERSLRGE